VSRLKIIISRFTFTRRKKEIKEKQFYKKEIRRGSFERIILLPCSVEDGQARAEFKDCILKIVLPKARKALQAPLR
jgi:HSP20 family protein